MSEMSLKKALLKCFSGKITSHGFKRKGSGGYFFKEGGLGRLGVSISFHEHPKGILVDMSFVIRVDSVQELLDADRVLDGLTEKDIKNKVTSTLGLRIEHIREGDYRELLLVQGEDYSEVCGELYDDFVQYGIPYFERFKTLHDVYAVTASKEDKDTISMPIPYKRANIVVTIAKLEGYPNLRDIYDEQLRELEKQTKGDRRLFKRYCKNTLKLDWVDSE